MTRKLIPIIVGFALAAFFTWLLARALNWQEVWATLESADKSWLALALVVFAAGYVARIARWRMLLEAGGARASFGAITPALLAGFALNNVLPMRIGDVMRTVMAKSAAGAPIALGVSTLLVERFWDLAALGLFFVFGVQAANTHASPGLIHAATLVAALGVAALIVAGLLGGPMARIAEAIAARTTLFPGLMRFAVSFFHALALVSKPALAGRLVLYSLAAWILEALVLYLCARAIGIPLSAQATCFILSTANFSALMPGTPGNIGTFHYFAVLAAGAFAIDADHGAALAILFHAMVWAPITIVGGALLATNARMLRLIPRSPESTE